MIGKVIGKMNPEVKVQLLEALRSGEFEQGTSALNADGKLCCLGVVCELAVKAGVVTEVDTRPAFGAPAGAVTYDGDWAYLPASVEEWAGLEHRGDLPETVTEEREGGWIKRFGALAELNDGGYTFGQIADIIEEQL